MTPRERFEELLMLDLDGDLSPAERAEFDALLAAHLDWAEEVRQERELVALLREAGKAKAPADLVAPALAAAHGGSGKAVEPISTFSSPHAIHPGGSPAARQGARGDGKHQALPWRQQALAAAILLVMAGAALALYYRFDDPQTRDWQVASGHDTPLSESKTVAMAPTARRVEAPSPASQAVMDLDASESRLGMAGLPAEPAAPSAALYAEEAAAPAAVGSSEQTTIMAMAQPPGHPAPSDHSAGSLAAAEAAPEASAFAAPGSAAASAPTDQSETAAPAVLADTPFLSTALALASGEPVPPARHTPAPGFRFRVLQSDGPPQVLRYEIASGPDAATLYFAETNEFRRDQPQHSAGHAESLPPDSRTMRAKDDRTTIASRRPAFPPNDVVRALEAAGGIAAPYADGSPRIEFPTVDAALRAVDQLRRGEDDPILDRLEVLATPEGRASVIVHP